MKTRNVVAFSAMAVLLLVLLVLNLAVGSTSVPFPEVWKALAGTSSDATASNVVLQLRLPRALAAVVLGGALALSGYLLQTFFHNPIAGPFILGVSSGAKLTVAIAMVIAMSNALPMSSAAMVAAAFVGAMLSMGLVLRPPDVCPHHWRSHDRVPVFRHYRIRYHVCRG